MSDEFHFSDEFNQWFDLYFGKFPPDPVFKLRMFEHRLNIPEEEWYENFWTTETAVSFTGLSSSAVRSLCERGRVKALKQNKWWILVSSLMEEEWERWHPEQ